MSGDREMRNLEITLKAPVPSDDWKVLVKTGIIVLFLTFVVFGGWAALAKLDGGVVAAGKIAVQSGTKTIQHLEGGIVREILVRNGDVVKKGDVLVRLDRTQRFAQSTAYVQQLAIARALEARLIAQRDMLDKVEFPPEVLALKDDPLVAFSMSDNRRQFENRRNGFRVSVEVLQKQINQVLQDIQQTKVDEKTAQERLASVNKELPALRELFKQGLVALPRITTLEREGAMYVGQIETSKVTFARANDKIAELKSRMDQAESDYRQEAATALPDVRNTLSTLKQQVVISDDTLSRVDITATNDGTIQNMKVFTIGGVIRPGDPILDLVPSEDSLVVQAKIPPVDIDRVRIKARVELRLPQFVAFHRLMMQGEVRSVSQDTLVDPDTKQSYFSAEIVADKKTIPPEVAAKLTAGMNVELIIISEERTALQFLLAPFLTTLETSMRER